MGESWGYMGIMEKKMETTIVVQRFFLGIPPVTSLPAFGIAILLEVEAGRCLVCQALLD